LCPPLGIIVRQNIYTREDDRAPYPGLLLGPGMALIVYLKLFGKILTFSAYLRNPRARLTARS